MHEIPSRPEEVQGRLQCLPCPGLPGCWSQGQTEEEALKNIQSAIREYLHAVKTLSKGSKVREVEVTISPCQSCPASIICALPAPSKKRAFKS